MTDVEQACDRLVVLAGGRLLLHAAVAEARARHRTIDAAALDGRAAVGTFRGPAGEALALSDDAGPGREATLEDIVLGYLAAARAGALAEVA